MLAPATPKETTLEPLQVLVVDDSEFYRVSLESIVTGFLPNKSKVLLAKNGEEALAALHADDGRIKCMLLDLHLEHESGLEVMKRAKQLRDDLTIIMVTSDEEMDIALNCMQQGAEDYVVKGSFTPATLERTIRYAIERMGSRLENQKLQKELSAEKRVNSLQRSFMNLVNHEFRTPLAIIYSAAQWLRQSGELEAPALSKRLDKIERAIGRMESLMNNVGMLDRLEEGQVECSRQPLDIKQRLEELIEGFDDALASQRIRADLFRLPEVAILDAGVLDYVISNVISNALKYSGEREVELWGDVVKDGIDIYVRDQGIGISSQDIARIGEKFFRAELSNHIPGTGLGLFLAQQFLRYQGGSLYICSEIDVGTTIKLHLPCDIGAPTT